MPDTTSYKTATFNGSESFAVARALRARMMWCEGQITLANQIGESEQCADYWQGQLLAATQALVALNASPLTPAIGG